MLPPRHIGAPASGPRAASAHGVAASGGAVATAAAVGGATAAVGAAGPPGGRAPQGRLRRGQQAVDDMRATAERLGLLGPLGAGWGAGGVDGGGAYIAELLQSVAGRAMLAWDIPRLRTALGWFEDFLSASRRVPFVPAIGPDAAVGAMWNRATLLAFGEFIRRSPPRGKSHGDHVRADAIAGYVSAIHLLRSREARYDVCPTEADLVGPLAGKQMRREDGPPGERKLCRGLRLEHLAAAAETFDRFSAVGCVEWAAALTAHSALLRGGEVGVPDDVAPEPSRIITWHSIRFQQPTRESAMRQWLMLMVVPIKDPTARRRGYPTPIARRHDGRFGADPLCAYDAVALAWWRRRHGGAPFPLDVAGRPAVSWWQRTSTCSEAPRLDAPFFADAVGLPMRTAGVRALVQRLAVLAGLDPAVFGAKSLRVGGATDWRDCLGDASAHVVKQRGRWFSDVAEVYQRPLLASHLAASMWVRPGGSADLESLCAGFAQAATR